MARELRYPWGKIVRMHAPRSGAAILIRLGHSMFPSSCNRDSEGGAELCGVGEGAQRAKLLKKGRSQIERRRTPHNLTLRITAEDHNV